MASERFGRAGRGVALVAGVVLALSCGVAEGAEESFAGDGPVELTIAEDVRSCTWTVKDFEVQARRQEEEIVRCNWDVKVEGDEVRVVPLRDGDGGGEAE